MFSQSQDNLRLIYDGRFSRSVGWKVETTQRFLTKIVAIENFLNYPKLYNFVYVACLSSSCLPISLIFLLNYCNRRLKRLENIFTSQFHCVNKLFKVQPVHRDTQVYYSRDRERSELTQATTYYSGHSWVWGVDQMTRVRIPIWLRHFYSSLWPLLCFGNHSRPLISVRLCNREYQKVLTCPLKVKPIVFY